MNRISLWNENRTTKVILGSAALQHRARNTKQVCNDRSVVTQMEPVSHPIRDGGQEDHLQSRKNLHEKRALEKMRRTGTRSCQANGFMRKKTRRERGLQVTTACSVDGVTGQEGKGGEDWGAELSWATQHLEGRAQSSQTPRGAYGTLKVVETPHKSIVKPISQCLFELCRCLLTVIS